MPVSPNPIKNFTEKERKELYSDKEIEERKREPFGEYYRSPAKSFANVLLNGIGIKKINRLTPPQYKDRMWLGFIFGAIILLICLVAILSSVFGLTF